MKKYDDWTFDQICVLVYHCDPMRPCKADYEPIARVIGRKWARGGGGYAKLRNLQSVITGGRRGLSHGNVLDAVVMKFRASDPKKFVRAARKIEKRLSKLLARS